SGTKRTKVKASGTISGRKGPLPSIVILSRKKNGVGDIVGIPFDDEAWAEATYFTKNNKGYGFGLTKQAHRIFRKAKRSALKRSRAYTSRISDEARIELEVTTRLESRMKAFEIEMKLRVEEQVQLQVQEQIKKFLVGLQIQAPFRSH
ncbi:hypothetical protein Tco_1208222, partial [Tanacetum coccineum]